MKRLRIPGRTGLHAAIALLAAGFVLGTAGSAAAQNPSLEHVRLVLPAQAVDALERTVAAARDRGLPVQPLLNKALEGAAKGFPPDRILDVIEQLSAQLGRAHELLAEGAPPPRPADVAAVADALQRGVPAEAVRSIRTQAGPDEPVAMAVHTLADLLEREVPVEHALGMLEAWHERGADPDDLPELPAAIERLMRNGVLPEQAAAAVRDAMRAGRRPAQAGPPDARGRPQGAGPPGANGRGGPPSQPPIPPGAGPPGKGRGGGGPGLSPH